jgi:hypothetical protein
MISFSVAEYPYWCDILHFANELQNSGLSLQSLFAFKRSLVRSPISPRYYHLQPGLPVLGKLPNWSLVHSKVLTKANCKTESKQLFLEW